MTRIIVWKPESRLGWIPDGQTHSSSPASHVSIAADSVLSSHNGALTSNASKILSLPIHLWKRYADEHGGPHRRSEVYKARMAFAFSGSSLSATTTYSFVSSVLSHLVGWEDRPRPSAQNIADYVARIGTRYIRDIGAVNANDALFEAALVMADPEPEEGARRKVVVFHLHANQDKIYKMVASQIPFDMIGDCLVLGEGRNEALKQVKAGFQRDLAFDPITLLQEDIEDSNKDKIGGSIYEGSVGEHGLDIRPLPLLCMHGLTYPEEKTLTVGEYSYSSGRYGDF